MSWQMKAASRSAKSMLKMANIKTNLFWENPKCEWVDSGRQPPWPSSRTRRALAARCQQFEVDIQREASGRVTSDLLVPNADTWVHFYSLQLQFPETQLICITMRWPLPLAMWITPLCHYYLNHDMQLCSISNFVFNIWCFEWCWGVMFFLVDSLTLSMFVVIIEFSPRQNKQLHWVAKESTNLLHLTVSERYVWCN